MKVGGRLRGRRVLHSVHKQTNKQGQVGRMEGGERRSEREKEERKRRGRQWALSCPNENKWLSDPLRTLKKKRENLYEQFLYFKKTTPSRLLENNDNDASRRKTTHGEKRRREGVGLALRLILC